METLKKKKKQWNSCQNEGGNGPGMDIVIR